MCSPPATQIEICSVRAVRGCSFPVIAFLILLGVAGSRAQTTAPQQTEKGDAAPAGNAEAGKKVFTKDGCYECHGREGQGAAQGAGPRIGPSTCAAASSIARR